MNEPNLPRRYPPDTDPGPKALPAPRPDRPAITSEGPGAIPLPQPTVWTVAAANVQIRLGIYVWTTAQWAALTEAERPEDAVYDPSGVRVALRHVLD